ncbi:MAG TPA: dTMP kinase [Candidatus Saccharimonadales bacterium]|nr:dTMP kinase [Candidatus Saccharimonadales bacterium]
MVERGKYIVIEGTDGTGKSTQVEMLRDNLTQRGIESIEFHEPGGVPIADDIRQIIKNGDYERDGETNLLLFTAARHEIWKQAKRELQLGKWVVAARNYYSTIAYQGYGEGLNSDVITETTRTFTDDDYMNPDLSVILTLDDEVERSKRIGQRGELANPDTFESKDEAFQHRVQFGYLAIARAHNLPVISASQSKETIHQEITSLVFPNDNN